MAHSGLRSSCIRRPGVYTTVFLISFGIFNLVHFGYKFDSSNCTKSEIKADFSSTSQARVLYGHVHIPKTAGTTLNGQLAARYERICGNKGYSFSAYQENVRRNQTDDVFRNEDYRKLYRSLDERSRIFTLGNYENYLMFEIGFEDCDYISHETPWTFWPDNFADWDVPLELHIPCRNPISHLMSMCNYKNVIFNCSAEPTFEVNKCIFGTEKFSSKLVSGYKNIYMKCFNAEIVTEYIKFMDGHLQRKKKTISYVFRKTNKDRTKAKECIWRHPTLMKRVKQYMISHFDYYSFCETCLNSSNNLLSYEVESHGKKRT